MSRKYIFYVLVAMTFFVAGFSLRGLLHNCPTSTIPEPKTKTITKIEYQDRVHTEIAYVPKETIVYKDTNGNTIEKLEKTDVDVKIDKPQLAVKVNGKEFTIDKTDDEKFLFEKNKLQMQQTSKATLDIQVPDSTRHWEIGTGYSKEGLVGQIGFPVAGNVGGWIAGKPGNVMAGINVKF